MFAGRERAAIRDAPDAFGAIIIAALVLVTGAGAAQCAGADRSGFARTVPGGAPSAAGS